MFKLLLVAVLANFVPGGVFQDGSTIVCKETEIFVLCPNPCEATCQDPNPPRCPFLFCIRGCVCAPGYVRDREFGKCVQVAECAALCLEKQEYTDCGSRCPPTCHKPNPKPCGRQCVSGCFCKENLRYDTITQTCRESC